MRGLIVAMALLLGSGLPALAEEAKNRPAGAVSAADRMAIEDVVAAQVAAIARDDAPAAYALASTGLKALFDGPDRFMAVVRADYGAVHRARQVTYLGVAAMEGKPVQQVLVISPSGEPMLAMFVMKQEAAGVWRVEACYLVRRPMMSA